MVDPGIKTVGAGLVKTLSGPGSRGHKPRIDPLLLSVNRGSAVANTLEPDAKQLRTVRQSAIKAGRNRCRYCEFRPGKYMRVHHLDHDYAHHEIRNLVPACSLCLRSLRLDVVANRNEAAEIIYLPEMTQAEVNNLVYACMAWQASGGDESVTAERTLQMLELRKLVAQQFLALTHQSGVAELADFLLRLPEKAYRQRWRFLKDIRLLIPGRRVLPRREIDYYAANVFSHTSPKTLNQVAERYLDRGLILKLPS